MRKVFYLLLVVLVAMLGSSICMKVESDRNRGYILTPDSGKYDSVLVWLHGIGGNADGFISMFNTPDSPLPPTMKVRLLTAPVSYVSYQKNSMNSWYDILESGKNIRRVNKDTADASAARVRAVIEEEAFKLGNKMHRVYLAGFSQGCGQAVYTGLQMGDKLGGLVGFSGYLLDGAVLPDKLPPTLIMHGTSDNVVYLDYAWRTYQARGLFTRKEMTIIPIENIGHAVSNEGKALMKTHINKWLAARP